MHFVMARPETIGAVAEWLRSGLQSREHRFDSGPRLQLVTVCVEHLIGSSSVVEQVAVNHLVGGSNPSSRANKINGLDVYSSSPFFI
jgi:hypothetical protein